MQNYKDNQLVNDQNAVLDVSILSVIGDREEQQDSFGYSLKVNEGIVIVCDGMGGHDGGQLASNLATELFISEYNNRTSESDICELMLETARQSDLKITELKRSDGQKLNAGSTCVAVVIKDKKVFWCSVGDSRAYLLRGEEFVSLTQDHNYETVLCEKRRAGLIDDEQYEKESKRGEALISYLGIGNLSLIDYNDEPLELESGDKIVMMSDGLYKLVPQTDICSIVQNFTNSSEALQALNTKASRFAKSKSEHRDNMTVAIITIR